MAIKTGVRVTSDGQNWTEFSGDGVLNSIQTTGLTADTLYTAIAFLSDDGTEITSNGAKFTTAPPFRYLTFKNEYAGDNTLRITKTGTPDSTDLAYSIDNGATWTDIHNGGGVTVRQGGEILIKSTTGLSKGQGDFFSFDMSEAYSVSGHIASLWGYRDATMTTLPDYGCYRMFVVSKTLQLVNIDFSGVTMINYRALEGMFYGCTSLTAFNGNISDLRTLYLRACYQMFYGCTSLTATPDLSGITEVYGSNYGGMNSCFAQCTSLTSVIAPNVEYWSTAAFQYWLLGVSPTGIFYKPAGLTVPTDTHNGVPSGWEVVNY